MLFKDIAYIDENFSYQQHAYIGTQHDRITYIGTEPPENADQYGAPYRGQGKLMLPGLYNAHAHTAMTLLRGYAEDLPLQRWLNERCRPFEAKMDEEDIYWATLLACIEMAQYGVVGFSDMHYGTYMRAKAVEQSGLKANLSEGFKPGKAPSYFDYPIAKTYEDYIAKLNGAADGRIKIDYNIHAEYTLSEEICSDIIGLVKEKGLRLQLHLSETKKRG